MLGAAALLPSFPFPHHPHHCHNSTVRSQAREIIVASDALIYSTSTFDVSNRTCLAPKLSKEHSQDQRPAPGKDVAGNSEEGPTSTGLLTQARENSTLGKVQFCRIGLDCQDLSALKTHPGCRVS